MILFTIGHSNSSMESLIERLRQHRVSFVIDVRSSPASRFQHFNRNPLDHLLQRGGLSYYFYGDLLGGRPDSGAPTQHQWRQGTLDEAIVKELRASDRWQLGLTKLAGLLNEQGARDRIGCLLCSEADPNHCHRLAIAFDLAGVLRSHLPKTDVRLQEPLLEM